LAFFRKIERYYKSNNGTILQFLTRSAGTAPQQNRLTAASCASRSIDALDQLIDEGTAPGC
jgi:hypothetical protein